MAKNSKAEFVASLERGLRVLQTFSGEYPQLTLSEVAALTGLTPATARRSLHTLEELGYVGQNRPAISAAPKVLAIGTGYLSAINAEVVLQPFLQEVVNEVGGSSSVTVLDEIDIVYIAHASLNRAIRLTAGAGSRYPAYPTSMGRVLLAFQPESSVDAYFERASLRRLTEQTETNPAALRRILKEVRTKGYAAIQDELDYGIVSVALPIFGPHGRIVGSRKLLRCHESARSRHDDQEAAAGAPAGRATHRRHAHAASRADELGRIRGVRLRAIARCRARGPATRQKSSGRSQRERHDGSSRGLWAGGFGLQVLLLLFLFCRSRPAQDVRHRVVAFVARVLIKAIVATRRIPSPESRALTFQRTVIDS